MSNNKKIVIISGIYVAETGGAVNIMSHIKNTKGDYVYKVYLVQNGSFKKQLDFLGVDNVVFEFKSKFNFLNFLKITIALWWEKDVYSFHTHTERICFLFNPLLRLMGKKVVTTVHRNIAVSSIWKSTIKNYIFVKLENIALQYFTNAIIYVSNTLRCQFIEGRRINTRSAVYKYFPIDPRLNCHNYQDYEVFDQISIMKTGGCIIAGTIARATLEKGLDVLIEQFSLFINSGNLSCPIVLVVFGESLDNYISYFRKDLKCENNWVLNNKIVFIGLNKNVGRFFELIDFYLQPSRSEAYGLAVLEASYYGVNIVTSDIPVFVETLEGYSGHHKVSLNDTSLCKILQENVKTKFLNKKTCVWKTLPTQFIETDVYQIV